MLVACRLRGLSALEPYYAGVRALAQCEARRRQISTMSPTTRLRLAIQDCRMASPAPTLTTKSN